MRALAAVAVFCLVQAGPLRAETAQPQTDCSGAEEFARADFALPRLTAAAKSGQIRIAVIGSASSQLGPQAGPNTAYPARLQSLVSERFPQIKFDLNVDARARRTAANMAEEFERVLKEKPSLVIWQTGTVDAMRGIDPDDFRAILAEGIEQLHEGGADVILMNMQYSPRTESMISSEKYLDAMRITALQEQVPLFDRFAVMKSWSESGAFDFATNARDFAQATRVHDCLGRLLSAMIAEILSQDSPPPLAKDTH